MFIVIGFMLAGVAMGYLTRRQACPWVPRLISGLIWALLFLLGWEVGGNETLIRTLPTLGWEAAGMATLATLGSCLAAWALQRILQKRRSSGRNGRPGPTI